MDRRGLVIGFLAGGWLATLLFVLLPHDLLTPASAGGGGGGSPPPVAPGGSGAVPVGPTVNPISGTPARGIVNPGTGTSDSNGRAIALSASVGGGASVVYYFDTEAERLCVYQYDVTSRGGLRLLAARSIEWDLKLMSYRDLSEKSPEEMREAYEANLQPAAGPGAGVLPTKRVDLPPQGR